MQQKSEPIRLRPDDGQVHLWVIYNKPKDFPEGYLARRHGSSTGPSLDEIKAPLQKLRELFDCHGFIKFERHPDDDAVIVETWI